MYCKNCGTEYATDQAVICVKCGAQKGTGMNYCPNCGRPTQPNSAVCLNCGVSLTAASEAKSRLAAGLLGIFLGTFGVHNFYLGYTSKAVIQLVCSVIGLVLSCVIVGAFVVFGIWVWGLVEGIMILTGKVTVDANGVPLKD